MSSVTIACVVEGHGEVKALQRLLFRIAHQFSIWDLHVPEPYRVSRGSLTRTGGIERAVAAQASRVSDIGGGIQNAKGWLSAHRTDGLKYSPTVDQATLASAFDLAQARKAAPSFDKLCRDVEVLLGVASSCEN